MRSDWVAIASAATGVALLGPRWTVGRDAWRDRKAPVFAGLTGARAARLGSAIGAWLAVMFVLGGLPGAVLGVLAGLGADRLVCRLEPAAVVRRRARRAADLPIALDLLAVSLRAGTPLVATFEVVARALPGALAEDFRVVAALQRLGAAPAAAWSDYAADPVLGPVAATVVRSAESGSRLAEAFERLAADRRADLVLEGEARARRAGVLAIAPLGLCFLPAFVCLGIIPLVLSIASTVLIGVP